MIGYICKYTPIEIFEAMGEEVRRIEPEVTSFNQADTLMHPNICSFAKGVLESALAEHYDGIVLTTCCDSIRRVYDVLREKLPGCFLYMLDAPRITKDAGVHIYERRIRDMIKAYEAYSGKTFDEEKLAEVIRKKEAETAISFRRDRPNIGILGARANPNIRRILEEHGANVAFDLTCTGLGRKLHWQENEPFTGYVRGLLSQFPCMRMETAANRDRMIEQYAGSVDGIIYHTIQFCDNYSYEYAWLKDILKKPQLLLETDNTKQSYGQILTRIEAFLESLQSGRAKAAGSRAAGNYVGKGSAAGGAVGSYAGKDGAVNGVAGKRMGKGSAAGGVTGSYVGKGNAADGAAGNRMGKGSAAGAAGKRMGKGSAAGGVAGNYAGKGNAAGGWDAAERTGQGGTAMYVLGIDSGSTSTNAVIMDQDRQIRAFEVVRTGAKSGESAERILKAVLEKAGLAREDLARVVSTGYGRVSIAFADENVTEISCHGKGAHYFNPKIRTILDIGGQDSKAIRLDERGEVVDFVMNDKCAAGTGRFLEAIARTLEIDISEVGPEALKSTEAIEITSMCTVFAESEVISLIANNKEKCDIANGICNAIANKAFSLMRRVGLEPDFMMTGGVAKNPGVVRAVESRIGGKLYICPEPEIVGAVGAALYALNTLGL